MRLKTSVLACLRTGSLTQKRAEEKICLLAACGVQACRRAGVQTCSDYIGAINKAFRARIKTAAI